MPKVLATIPAAVLLALALASLLPRGLASGAGDADDQGEPAAQPGAAKETGPTGRPRDAQPRDPDQDLIDHLEQVERMELLQNLELFDTSRAKKRG